MYTTIVNIGRNVNDEQGACLTSEDWADFRVHVFDLLMAHGYRTADGNAEGWYVSDSRGVGFWEGIAEDNATFQLLHENEITPANYEELRNDLKLFARRFRQDAIAFKGNLIFDLVPASAPEGIDAI